MVLLPPRSRIVNITRRRTIRTGSVTRPIYILITNRISPGLATDNIIIIIIFNGADDGRHKASRRQSTDTDTRHGPNGGALGAESVHIVRRRQKQQQHWWVVVTGRRRSTADGPRGSGGGGGRRVAGNAVVERPRTTTVPWRQARPSAAGWRDGRTPDDVAAAGRAWRALARRSSTETSLS